mmetsp:Transcript_18639/g.31182  ORF Transcript_18639/g.31182 Transcript_18639/m.31182 type:complete len:203 (+) Transcript_18639:1277-1885(+)
MRRLFPRTDSASWPPYSKGNWRLWRSLSRWECIRSRRRRSLGIMLLRPGAIKTTHTTWVVKMTRRTVTWALTCFVNPMGTTAEECCCSRSQCHGPFIIWMKEVQAHPPSQCLLGGAGTLVDAYKLVTLIWDATEKWRRPFASNVCDACPGSPLMGQRANHINICSMISVCPGLPDFAVWGPCCTVVCEFGSSCRCACARPLL